MPATHTIIVNAAYGGSTTGGTSADSALAPILQNWQVSTSDTEYSSEKMGSTGEVNDISPIMSPTSNMKSGTSIYEHVKKFGPDSANMLVSYYSANTTMLNLRENGFLPCNYISHTSTRYEIGFGEHTGAYMTGKSSTDNAEMCNQGMIYTYSTGRIDLQYDVNYMYLS